MIDKRILEKAIEKAENNGFDLVKWDKSFCKNCKPKYKLTIESIIDVYHHKPLYNILIFNHDFAKAFWGNEENALFHLQGMVCEKEPLQYLRRFLEEK